MGTQSYQGYQMTSSGELILELSRLYPDSRAVAMQVMGPSVYQALVAVSEGRGYESRYCHIRLLQRDGYVKPS